MTDKLFLGLVVMVGWLNGGLWLLGDLVAEPTTMVGAFITISVMMGGLVVWIVKKLFEVVDKQAIAIQANQIAIIHNQESIERLLQGQETERKALEELHGIQVEIYDDLISRPLERKNREAPK